MNKDKVYDTIFKTLGEDRVLSNEPMKRHTYFKIGGPADILVLPKTVDEIIFILDICKENGIDYFIMGNGTNLLVTDKGIRGIVVKIGENFNDIKINGNKIVAQGGSLLSQISKIALNHGLTGMEFASGIPGSIGGAVTMNAGAYGPEMKDIVTKVKCIDSRGRIKTYSNEDMEFGYRYSRVVKDNLIVVEVEMELNKGEYGLIKVQMDDLTKKRTSKQPLNMPSAGSTFKRPEGDYASRLIDAAGLKGVRFGDAQVSDKHCGFVVNCGNATAEDVLRLIKFVQKTIKDKFDIKLEPEIKIIGER
ncbi:UDP-N-acetylmuramate dehydrogenase [Clostridiisalibacter paucivorans]|uniref:UDP-N-acetylmuramate dehydrogenase n=1 Tax=Clostridiisalibacter paucivorans TaxID=408753 RepID=UPI00047B1D2E|nr:UDP-N-acetylmuramate dehydrogenase [Clostridiisalibacter paucivorans]